MPSLRRLLGREPDPFSTYQDSGVFRSVRRRERKHMRHRWQWIVLGICLVIIGLSGYSLWFYYHTQGKIQDPALGGRPVGAGSPFNVLLVGSDSRGTFTPEEQEELGAHAVGGERADSLILARIDPSTNRVVMVQFPRDYYVEIAGKGEDRISSALNDGRETLVRTVEQLTGLEVNHYVQVNLAGFRDLVDAIGGVEVCIPEPIPFDRQTGIEVTEDEVGMINFGGDRALRFVRARKVFGGGDFDRIRNQQRFLAAAIDKAMSRTTLLRPDRIVRMGNVAGDNMKVDRDTDLRELARIGGRFREFTPDTYEVYTAPHLGTARVGGASVVMPNEPVMEVLFDAMRRNRSPLETTQVPPIEPDTIRVGVYNGTFEAGVAGDVADSLRAATDGGNGGVDIVEVANADRFGFENTIIRYREEAENMARLVAAAMPNAELREGPTRRGIDVAVIVGERGMRTRPIVQLIPIPIPTRIAMRAAKDVIA
jgi:LCP family protein required for cell wall assembly